MYPKLIPIDDKTTQGTKKSCRKSDSSFLGVLDEFTSIIR